MLVKRFVKNCVKKFNAKHYSKLQQNKQVSGWLIRSHYLNMRPSDYEAQSTNHYRVTSCSIL